MNKIFIEAFRRLYRDGKISSEKVLELCEKYKLSDKDREYILGITEPEKDAE